MQLDLQLFRWVNFLTDIHDDAESIESLPFCGSESIFSAPLRASLAEAREFPLKPSLKRKQDWTDEFVSFGRRVKRNVQKQREDDMGGCLFVC